MTLKALYEYARYVARHKYYVWVAGRVLKVSLWRLVKHDWSKFLPSEFFPYAEYFYGEAPAPLPTDRPNRMQNVLDYDAMVAERFDRAWLLHQHRNDHHWQAHVLHEDSGEVKALPMTPMQVREMASDWFGAGKAITGLWGAQAWYEENKHRMTLHPGTRADVEDLLLYGSKMLREGKPV